jgi:predicted esterase
MKKVLIVLSFLLLCPISVFANCSNTGTTVVFINGLFGNIESAKNDTNNLGDVFKLEYPAANVKFITGFNESHLGGADDLAKGIIQSYGYESLDYDLTTILNQIHGEVSTKKILLVGYSQGSFYSNAAYKYLIGHGALPNR